MPSQMIMAAARNSLLPIAKPTSVTRSSCVSRFQNCFRMSMRGGGNVPVSIPYARSQSPAWRGAKWASLWGVRRHTTGRHLRHQS